MKPVIYLDVDGVLNALPFGNSAHKLPRLTGWDDHEKSKVPSPIEGDKRVFTFWTSKKLGAALCELDADIEWLTTWGEQADTHVAELCGLPRDLPVTGTVDSYRETRPETGLFVVNSFSWKLESLLNSQKENPRPFVWIDDDAIDFAAEKLVEENCGDTPHLFVRTSHNLGITRAEFAEIETFLDGLEEES